ncbi:MAG: hypothetical protein QW728_07465 [Thermoplasmata archaeon]
MGHVQGNNQEGFFPEQKENRETLMKRTGFQRCGFKPLIIPLLIFMGIVGLYIGVFFLLSHNVPGIVLIVAGFMFLIAVPVVLFMVIWGTPKAEYIQRFVPANSAELENVLSKYLVEKQKPFKRSSNPLAGTITFKLQSGYKIIVRGMPSADFCALMLGPPWIESQLEMDIMQWMKEKYPVTEPY